MARASCDSAGELSLTPPQLQGGDFTDASGTGGESIYGLKFPGASWARNRWGCARSLPAPSLARAPLTPKRLLCRRELLAEAHQGGYPIDGQQRAGALRAKVY